MAERSSERLGSSTAGPEAVLARLPGYRIIEKLGEGGMGAIHQDIKPENFLFARPVVEDIEDAVRKHGARAGPTIEELLRARRREAWVKLNDWGLALLARRPDESGSKGCGRKKE